MKAGRRSIYVGAAAIVQLLTACSGEPAADNHAAPSVQAGNAAAPVADGKLVLAFGDSLYAGYGVAQNESFPFRLEQALKAQGLAVQVRNAGVSGETSLGGLQRLAFTLDGLPRKPDLLLLDLGGNDMLRGLPPEDSEKNLRAILDELKRRQIPVLLTGMLAAPNMGKDYGAKFDAIYPRLAKDYGLPLYPFFLDGVIGDPKLMQADSIHPNPAGVNIVVGRIAPVVAGLLKDA
ncbi:arylesterase [Sphingobium indicum]|uniref:ORFW n=3 Tax=Sphingomonadaceae TaxID=41297 RepID=Q6VQX6_SPHPI|nr:MULTISPECIES: arylesterase [Sphingobium]EPR17433.1 GDSL family lipase [Sphingobium indicum IP26]KEY97767.1 GDSL family lipase [Sphingomonas sp. BHC-A]AAR05976.1 ORFW [Sphingobium indicum B90A]APL96495.1 GDSL family lipase [Sphingobium indicum B90A]EQB09029.1 GDSL family lipase [Sphingobium sp. HDIP04]